jgi:hypothetical protein
MLNKPTVFGRIKEKCGYVFDDIEQEVTELVYSSNHHQEILRRDLAETGQGLKNQYKSVRLDLQADFEEIKNGAKEDWQKLQAVGSQWKSRMVGGGSTNQPPRPQPQPQEADDEVEGNTNLREEIRSFEEALRSESFMKEVDTSIQNQLSSADLINYYRSRPELKEYTIEKELHRMKYTLYTHDGKKITEADQIANYAKEMQGNSISETHELLWRAANQSIFGDLITSLTSEAGMVRPQIGTATFVDDCSIVIDLGRDKPNLRAECFLNLSIPGAEGKRLSMGGVLVAVYFCPDLDLLKAKVLHVSPSPRLSEDQVSGTAESSR